MDEETDIDESLAKSRRFLLVLSLAVIALYALKISLKCEAEYSGFGVILRRPENVVYGLWIVWAWALWRYMQRLNALWANIREEVQHDVDLEDLRISVNAARRYLVALCRRGAVESGIDREHRNARVVGPISLYSSKDAASSGEAIKRPTFYSRTSDGGRRYEVRGAYNYTNNLREEGTIGFNPSMIWTRRRTRVHLLSSWIAAMLRLPALTDHAAPTLVALIALASPLIFPSDGKSGPRCDQTGKTEVVLK